MAETTAVVVIGGLPINKSVAKYLPKHDFVVAADSGLLKLIKSITCIKIKKITEFW